MGFYYLLQEFHTIFWEQSALMLNSLLKISVMLLYLYILLSFSYFIIFFSFYDLIKANLIYAMKFFIIVNYWYWTIFGVFVNV